MSYEGQSLSIKDAMKNKLVLNRTMDKFKGRHHLLDDSVLEKITERDTETIDRILGSSSSSSRSNDRIQGSSSSPSRSDDRIQGSSSLSSRYDDLE